MSRRSVLGCLIVGWLSACSTDTTVRLWPDRSDALPGAREAAKSTHQPQAAAPNPGSLRIGFLPSGSTDAIVDAWQHGLAPEEPQAPTLLAVVSSKDPRFLAVPRARSERRAFERDLATHPRSGLTDDNVLKAVASGHLDCGRARSASFVEGALSGAPLVAVARFDDSDNDLIGRFELHQRASLDDGDGTPMSGRRFAMQELDAFSRSAANHWLRQQGLNPHAIRVTVLPSDTSLDEVFRDATFDYVFVSANKTRRGGKHGVVLTSAPNDFPDPHLLQTVLVCRRDSLANHRLSLERMMAKWVGDDLPSAPKPLQVDRLFALVDHLQATGIVHASRKPGEFIDSALMGGLY